ARPQVPRRPALDEQRVPAVAAVQGRHATPLRVEGELADAGPAKALRIGVKSALDRQHQERLVQGVADAAAVAVGMGRYAVVAEGAATQEPGQGGAVAGRLCA